MQSEELLDDRLQPLAALLRDALQLERVVDPAAPLVGEDRQQPGEREHARQQRRVLAAAEAASRPTGASRRRPGTPTRSPQLGARVHAEPDPQPQRKSRGRRPLSAGRRGRRVVSAAAPTASGAAAKISAAASTNQQSATGSISRPGRSRPARRKSGRARVRGDHPQRHARA